MVAYYNSINNFCHTSDRQINLPSDNDDFYGLHPSLHHSARMCTDCSSLCKITNNLWNPIHVQVVIIPHPLPMYYLWEYTAPL